MTTSPPGPGRDDRGDRSLGELDIVRPPDEPHGSLALWTKLGLACLFLAVATPLVGLSGLWASALLGQLAAAGLEVSHANLPPVPITAALDVRVVYLLALAVMGLRAGVSRLPRPTWNVAGLGPWHWWLLLGGGLWLAAVSSLVFERELLDIDDGVHLVALGGTWLWSTATAMWLIASVGRAGVVLLAVASQRSRVVSGSVAFVGIASMVVATPVLANPEVLDADSIYHDAPLLAAMMEDIDATATALRLAPARTAGEPRGSKPTGSSTVDALPPAGRTSVADDRYSTYECMEKLVEPENEGPSRLTKVIRKLRRDHENRGIEVEDLVYGKMIDVCMDEPRRNGKDLFGLLLQASRNGLVDSYRHGEVVAKSQPVLASYRARCLIDASNEVEESYEDRQHRLATAEEALKTLDPDDRALLDEHYVEQLPYADMARSRGKTTGSVTKATNRAVHELRMWLANRCH